MRHLTTVGAAAIACAVGIVVASPAVADPADTDPTSTESSAAPSSATPSSTSESSTAPSSTAPSSTAPTTAVESDSGAARQVTYTITTTSDLTANIYYVAGDPPDQASANKPQYMPMARTTVGPGAPWTMQATLDDPTQWAFVSASGGLRVNPEFRCEIAVDGQVVVSQQGGSGVQCALRPW